MNGFSLIGWQDDAAAELMAYYAMGAKRGNFQVRLIRKRLDKELARAGYTNDANRAAIINDVCDYAQLLIVAGIPNHGDGWGKRL